MKLHEPIKQYGNFSAYPYPLSTEGRLVIERTTERVRAEALASFHTRERECDSSI